MNNYDIGIFWCIGSFAENRLSFRHKNKFYIERMQEYFPSKIYQQIHHNTGENQYVLKTQDFKEYEYLKVAYNSNSKPLPKLKEYSDFLRAYIEIHSTLDYLKRINRNGHIWYKLRLRIFGNMDAIDDINNILHENLKVGIKTPQKTANNTTKILYYQSYDEIKAIFEYINGDVREKMFWNDAEAKLNAPIK